jgi:hypothetical protein
MELKQVEGAMEDRDGKEQKKNKFDIIDQRKDRSPAANLRPGGRDKPSPDISDSTASRSSRDSLSRGWGVCRGWREIKLVDTVGRPGPKLQQLTSPQ